MLKYDTWSRSFGVFNLLFLNKNLLIIILFLILKFIAVFIIIFSILKSSFNKIKINFLLILIGIFYFFCTPILLAITNHYQSVVLNKIFLSEPITYFSYFYLIFTITVIVFWINNKLQNNIIRNCFVLFVAIIFSIISLIMDFSNINYNISQTIAKNKWSKVDQFIKTEDFKLIPNGSIVYTTNLSDSVGTLIINEKNYWSHYIKAKTGKDLIIIDTIDSSNSKKYTLKYNN
jgi:hypothetical protein